MLAGWSEGSPISDSHFSRWSRSVAKEVVDFLNTVRNMATHPGAHPRHAADPRPRPRNRPGGLPLVRARLQNRCAGLRGTVRSVASLPSERPSGHSRASLSFVLTRQQRRVSWLRPRGLLAEWRNG